ncbi:ABC transporter substrate-binding protein [Salinispirillum marinum]|uniref:ABC transporter substrate-binding protein n=2 Tax=Saccharospirillaceae TaxID=255527 RepID=A0ABV8B9S3_9GAMM
MKKTWLILSALGFVMLSSHTVAQEMRRFVDDLGRSVVYPATPERIATLHDIELTVPLLELGAPVVASHGRPGAGGVAMIRSGVLLTGQDFSTSDIINLGHNPIDLEVLTHARPDLIITSTWQQADVDKLSAIAPTIVIDTRTGKRSDYELYDLLADLTGNMAMLDRLKARYDAQLAQLRRVVGENPRIVSAFHAQNGNLSVWNPYSSFGKVLRDAGFSFPEVIENIPEGTSEQLSVERLPELDADVIFVSYRSDRGETPADAHAELEAAFPGYCTVLTACQNHRLVVIPREEGWATSYVGLTMIAYAVTTVMGTLDFSAGY